MIFKKIYCVLKKTEYQHYHQNDQSYKNFKSLNDDFREEIWESHKNQIKFFTKFMEISRDLNLNVEVVSESNIDLINYKRDQIIISCGGDGTFLSCAQNFPQAVLLGMNSDLRDYSIGRGSIGGLTNINKYNLYNKLKNIARGSGKIEFWSRLGVSVNGIAANNYAVNDVFIGNPLSYLTCSISVQVGPLRDDFNCSGFIACTGMGSHAWFTAAGGSHFSNELKAFGYMVLLPSKKWRPKFISGISSFDNYTTVIPHRDGYIMSFDSKIDVIKIKAGDRIKIFIDEKNPLKVFMPGDH